MPDADVLLALSPEELGFHLIGHIASTDDKKLHASALQGSLFDSHSEKYPQTHRKPVLDALMEAWTWLESEALIVLTDGSSNGWVRLSRRATGLTEPAAFAEYRAARMLPKEILHPKIRQPVWLDVMRGDYEIAVFRAMKAVEVAVREASGLEGVGVKLMRAAFHQDTGPLADLNADGGEREARMHLFAGAIGSFKNPVSHRDIPLEEAGAVIEQILLANHLLRIVDERRAALAS
ncbi:MAG: TIGR02391 family protein [Novosphingobium sp.]